MPPKRASAKKAPNKKSAPLVVKRAAPVAESRISSSLDVEEHHRAPSPSPTTSDVLPTLNSAMNHNLSTFHGSRVATTMPPLIPDNASAEEAYLVASQHDASIPLSSLPPGWVCWRVGDAMMYIDHISREAHKDAPPWVVWHKRALKRGMEPSSRWVWGH